MFKSLDEALSRKIELVERIQGIDVQLSERAVEQGPGYQEWKLRAIRAKYILVSKLHKTKAWIAQRRKEEIETRIKERGEGDGLLADLYALSKALVGAGAEITHDEQALLDDVYHYLNS